MGELARKPGAPKLAETPLETLTARPGEGFTVFDKYVHPVSGFICGIGAAILSNALQRRPYWAGFQRFLVMGSFFTFAGFIWRDMKMEGRSEKDAILKHYISLHPEDFPPYERKRYRDVFNSWAPVR